MKSTRNQQESEIHYFSQRNAFEGAQNWMRNEPGWKKFTRPGYFEGAWAREDGGGGRGGGAGTESACRPPITLKLFMVLK